MLKNVNPKEEESKEYFFKVMTKDGKFDKIEFDNLMFLDKLKELGFFRLNLSEENFIYVHIRNSIIRQVSETSVIDAMEDYIINLGTTNHKIIEVSKDGMKLDFDFDITADAVRKKFVNSLNFLFEPRKLTRLRPDKEIVIKKDTQFEKFFYYQNGYVTITKDGHTFNTYDNMQNYVWESMVLPREFNITDDKISYAERFLRNISARRNEQDEIQFDRERFNRIRTITGYAMHDFTKGKLKLPILTDSKICADGEPNGRTGKTLHGKMIAEMLNANDKALVYLELSGKNFNTEDPKKYRSCGIDTQLVNLNDVKANFNVEALFTDISDGYITIHKNHQEPIKKAVKMMLSTNMTILLPGDSAADRCIVFEFSDYYSSKFSPENEFKHWFFRDWNLEEWNRFDLFMFNCVKDFLLNGISEASSINIEKRMLQDHTSVDFLTWFTDLIHNKIIPECDLTGSCRMIKKDMYNEFVEAYEDFRRASNMGRYKQTTFTKWVRMFSKQNSFIKPIEKADEVRTNGSDIFVFRKK